MTSGVLLLDKPPGLSSSSATQRVRHLLGRVKAGHVGSLDPLATGMLPICLGEATKVAGEILDGAKVYTFRIQFGRRTATGDLEGEIVEECALPALDEARIAGVLRGFLGEQQQVPPMYSAIKRAGQPLYKLARAGLTVERAARRIHIYALDALEWGTEWLDCRVRCGKGTYVRVLAEDIAAALGSCGHVARLRRESVEPFAASDMITLEALGRRVDAGQDPGLIPAERAIGHLPAVELDAEAARRLGLGQSVAAGPARHPRGPPSGAESPAGATTMRVFGPGGRFLGLGLLQADGRLQPKRLLVAGP